MPRKPAETRLQRRRTRTRAALLDAARGIFARDGIEGATVQEITDAADVAKGSFYNHFDSRDDVLRAVVAATLDDLGAGLDRRLAEVEADPARVVAASLLGTLRLCVENPTLGGFLLRTPEIAGLAEGALGDRGRRDLLRGRESGRFRFEDLEVVINAISGGAQGVLRGRLHGELEEGCEQGYVSLVMRMLGLPPDEADEIAGAVDVAPPGGGTE